MKQKHPIDDNIPHIPVLLHEMLTYLAPAEQQIYVDATFGAGGYTRAILEHSATAQVYAIDQDPEVAKFAEVCQRQYGDRFHFLQGKFSQMDILLQTAGVKQVHGIVMDIGVSSMQIDQPERGFSFLAEAKLDMRMNRNVEQKLSAFEVVNLFSEEHLADIIYQFGDEVFSRKIAHNIVKARHQAPITTTTELAELVRISYPIALRHKARIDPATKTFQAIRIFINQELEELENALAKTTELLAPGGRLVVVTFHSLEDRIVKTFLRRESGTLNSEKRNKYKESMSQPANFQLLTKKGIQASAAEINYNIRARSARLRAAIRN